MNPDRRVLGLAMPYGEAARDTGELYTAGQFDRFLDGPLLMGYPPIRPGHQLPIDERERLGWWYAFRHLDAEGVPPGLLCLGTFGESPVAISMFDHIATDPKRWGLSIAARDISAAEDRSDLFLEETSVTQNPAMASARVLAVGLAAESLWETLTGTRVAPMPKREMRTVEGRAIVVGGRVHRETWQEPV